MHAEACWKEAMQRCVPQWHTSWQGQRKCSRTLHPQTSCSASWTISQMSSSCKPALQVCAFVQAFCKLCLSAACNCLRVLCQIGVAHARSSCMRPCMSRLQALGRCMLLKRNRLCLQPGADMPLISLHCKLPVVIKTGSLRHPNCSQTQPDGAL